MMRHVRCVSDAYMMRPGAPRRDRAGRTGGGRRAARHSRVACVESADFMVCVLMIYDECNIRPRKVIGSVITPLDFTGCDLTVARS